MLHLNSENGGKGDLFCIKTQLFPNPRDDYYSQICRKYPVYMAEKRLGLNVLLSTQTSSFCLRVKMAEERKQ